MPPSNVWHKLALQTNESNSTVIFWPVIGRSLNNRFPGGNRSTDLPGMNVPIAELVINFFCVGNSFLYLSVVL